MRVLPQQPYCGLTVVVDQLYRNDFIKVIDDPDHPDTCYHFEPRPISGIAGTMFDNELLAAGYNHVHRGSIEIRTLDDIEQPFLVGTRCVMMLGEGCAKQNLKGLSLDEQRGAPTMRCIDLEGGGEAYIPFIFSYAPQPAYDRQGWFDEDGDEDDDAEESVQATKSHGRTRRKNWRFWLKADIRKAVRISQEGLHVEEPRIVLFPAAERVINDLLHTSGKNLFFDIETEDNLQLTCFGYSFGEEVVVVPMLQTHAGNTYYYADRTPEILHALGCAFLRNRVIAHNGAFDLYVMAWRYGLPLPRKVFCTMRSWSRCYIEVERSLGHVLSYLTDLPFHKNEGVYKPWNSTQAEQLYNYNGKDVWGLMKLLPAIEAEAMRLGSLENVELVNRSFLPYLAATLRGARLDMSELSRIVTEGEHKMVALQEIVSTLAGFPLNPRSTAGQWSVKAFLYGKDGLGIKLPAKDPTNEKTLYQVLLKSKEPIIPWIIKFRQTGKTVSALGFDPWEASKVGVNFTAPRMSTEWKFNAVTYRRQSSAISNKFAGYKFVSNFQNWAKETRGCIIADEGYSLFQIDQAGADARCVAWLTRHGEYRELFIHGIKPHTFLALHLFKDVWKKYFPPADIARLCSHKARALKLDPAWSAVDKFIRATDDPSWKGMRYYFICKKIIHSKSYGMGVRTFRLDVLKETEGTVNLSNEEASHFLAFLDKLFPELNELQAEVRRELRRTGRLLNLFGHPREFTAFYQTNEDGDSQFREAYAYKPSSTVAQIIAYAVAELHERKQAGDELLIEADYQFLQDGHDALVGQARTEFVTQVCDTACTHINRTLRNSRGEEFVMGSEFNIGQRWSFK